MDKKSYIYIIPEILFYWYITIFISTEFLSYFHLINRFSVILVNSIFSILIIILFRQEIKAFFRSILNKRNVFIYIIITILSLTFLQGFLSAPNTTDSMVRRLPIVMYWVQEHTLYQDIIRNDHDFMAPFSEYLFLHLYLIFDSDRMLFFSQWIAYAATILLSFLLVQKLGGFRRVASYSSLLIATLPIAVLQATSVQMDMLTTVMVLFSIYFALIFKDKPNITNSLLLGFAVGLGILSKATYLVYIIFPAGILIPFFLRRWSSSFVLGILIAVIIGSIQVRFVEQNLRLYGSISGEKGKSVYKNELITPQVIFSNLIKNFIVQFPFPVGKGAIEQGVIYIHNKIGYSIDDPRTNYFDVKFALIPIVLPQEDQAGNPVHLIIIITGGMALILCRDRFKDISLTVYLYLLSVVSFLLFSAVLKWQPFHSRLLMPFFIVGAVTSAIMLCRIEKLRGILNLLLTFSVILSFMIIIFNASKPFISYNSFYNYVKVLAPPLSSVPQSIFTSKREKQYFNARFYWYKPYKEIMEMVAKEKTHKTITFDLALKFEYPFWYFLKKYNLPYKVIPFDKRTNETLIISTSKDPYKIGGYTTRCIKTEVEYGYACLSKAK